MAWVATDNFDSYTVTEDLNGKNGGSGWSGAWTLVGGAMTIQVAPAGMSGNAVRCIDADSEYTRNVASAVTVGTMSFKFRTNSTAPGGNFVFKLREGGTSRMFFRANTTGDFQIFNGNTTVYDTIQAYAADTTYTITFDFDNVAQPNKYRIKVDAGSYTTYKDVSGLAYTNIDQVSLDAETGFGTTVFLDDIQNAGEAANILMPQIVM